MPEDIDIGELIAQSRRKAISEDIASISKELSGEAAKEGLATIPEDAFMNVFLPFFSDQGVNTYNVTVANWETLAANGTTFGGFYNEVIVVNRLGEELYRVPPLKDRAGIRPKEDRRIRLSEVTEEAKKYAHLKPTLGQKHLVQNLLHVSTDMTLSANGLEYVRRWNTIFTRYGLKPLIDLKENNEQSHSDNQGDSSYEFEDI